MHDKLAELDKHQTFKPVMINVVSSIPTGGNFIFCWNILKSLDVNFEQKCQKCQICVIYETFEWNQRSPVNMISYLKHSIIFMCQ